MKNMERMNEYTKITRDVQINLGDETFPMICVYPCSITIKNELFDKMTEEQIDRLFADSTKCLEFT